MIGAEVASNGEPVEIAVATICVGDDVGDASVMEAMGVDVIWRAPMEEILTLGTDALLQQLVRSLLARQQYTP